MLELLLCNNYSPPMSPSLKIMLANACLIAVLLWTQMAVVQHGIKHDLAYTGHEVSEVCDVYANTDSAKAVLDYSVPILFAQFGLNAMLAEGNDLVGTHSNKLGPRAPPAYTV